MAAPICASGCWGARSIRRTRRIGDQSDGAETARARSGVVDRDAGQSLEGSVQSAERREACRGGEACSEPPAHRPHRLRRRQRLGLYDRPADRAQAPVSRRQLHMADGRGQSRPVPSLAFLAEDFAAVPIAVLDRPGFRLKARASQAGKRFQEFHVDESDAAGLARLAPPAWTILSHRLSRLSSTKLRSRSKSG